MVLDTRTGECIVGGLVQTRNHLWRNRSPKRFGSVRLKTLQQGIFGTCGAPTSGHAAAKTLCEPSSGSALDAARAVARIVLQTDCDDTDDGRDGSDLHPRTRLHIEQRAVTSFAGGTVLSAVPRRYGAGHPWLPVRSDVSGRDPVGVAAPDDRGSAASRPALHGFWIVHLVLTFVHRLFSCGRTTVHCRPLGFSCHPRLRGSVPLRTRPRKRET
jgi:hypothetical protein